MQPTSPSNQVAPATARDWLPQGPPWPELLRYAPGSLLRIELALPPALREALQAASVSAERWLGALDGAVLQVDRLSDAACQLSCRLDGAAGEFSAVPADSGGYRLRGCLIAREATRTFEFDRAVIQTGGPHDAYLAQSVAGRWHHLLRLSYAGREADRAAEVWVCTAACAPRARPALRAVLPAQFLLARLVPLPS